MVNLPVIVAWKREFQRGRQKERYRKEERDTEKKRYREEKDLQRERERYGEEERHTHRGKRYTEGERDRGREIQRGREREEAAKWKERKCRQNQPSFQGLLYRSLPLFRGLTKTTLESMELFLPLPGHKKAFALLDVAAQKQSQKAKIEF